MTDDSRIERHSRSSGGKVDKKSDFWAITCYFNPAGYQRRLANYRAFRERLSVPLVAVELAYGSSLELTEDDAEILVQLHGGDVLWQKERLLNLALQRLPAECSKVAWLDCDIIFGVVDWAERTRVMLDDYPLVQPYSHLYHVSYDWKSVERWQPKAELRRSVASLIASGMTVEACLGTTAEEVGCSPGFAWAARREVLQQHQLYDACILGSADSAMIRAAYGCFEYAMRRQYMDQQRGNHYLAWAEPFYNSVSANVAVLEGDLVHLWHGQLEHRRYHERLKMLKRFQFDPFEDIAVDCNGAWRWNSNKREMHHYIRDYFAARREDG